MFIHEDGLLESGTMAKVFAGAGQELWILLLREGTSSSGVGLWDLSLKDSPTFLSHLCLSY